MFAGLVGVLVGDFDEAEGFEREDREDAGHEVEDEAA